MIQPLRFLTLLARYGLHPAFCGRLRRIVTAEWLRPRLASARRALEIGAGDGKTLCLLARRYPRAQFVASEQDPKQLRRLRGRLKVARLDNVTVAEGDFHDYAATAPFDLIYAVDVLEHIPDDLGFLMRVRECLAPSGALFIHVPTPGIPIFEDPGHVRPGYTQESLREVLERAGFCVERMEFTFGRRGMRHHHSLEKISRWRRAMVYLMDAADDEKVPSELGVLATREDFKVR